MEIYLYMIKIWQRENSYCVLVLVFLIYWFHVLVLFLQLKKGTNLCTVSTQFPFVLRRHIVNGGWSELLNWLIVGMLHYEMTVLGRMTFYQALSWLPLICSDLIPKGKSCDAFGAATQFIQLSLGCTEVSNRKWFSSHRASLVTMAKSAFCNSKQPKANFCFRTQKLLISSQMITWSWNSKLKSCQQTHLIA